jgi:hypothetical protein
MTRDGYDILPPEVRGEQSVMMEVLASRLSVRATKWFFLLASLIWASLIFTTAFFTESPGKQRFDEVSDLLVVGKIEAELSVWEEFSRFGGLLHGQGADTPYVSHSGLQGTVLHFIYTTLDHGLDPSVILAISRVVVAILLAATVVAMAAQILGTYGTMAIAIAVSVFVSFRWVTLISDSIYWVFFLHFLPFLFAWILYPAVIRGRIGFPAFVTVIGFLLFLKAMTEYVNLTNVIAATSVAVVYFGIVEGHKLELIIKRIIVLGLAGVVGFAAALLINIGETVLYSGSMAWGVQAIWGRASMRTYGEQYPNCFPGNSFQVFWEFLKLQLGFASRPTIGTLHWAYIVILPIVLLMGSIHKLLRAFLIAVAAGTVLTAGMYALKATRFLDWRLSDYQGFTNAFWIGVSIPWTGLLLFSVAFVIAGIWLYLQNRGRLSDGDSIPQVGPDIQPRFLNLRVVGIGILLLGVVCILVSLILTAVKGTFALRLIVILGGSLVVIGLGMATTDIPIEIHTLMFRRRVRALYVATGWSIPCAWTWFFFAPNSSACHLHLLGYVFFVPFGIMLACLLGAIAVVLVMPLFPMQSTPDQPKVA